MESNWDPRASDTQSALSADAAMSTALVFLVFRLALKL